LRRPVLNIAGADMSERMSSVEIEDVLSSIRRLVTQDLRPRPSAADEKLLLTPALRVVPEVKETMQVSPFIATTQDIVEVADDDVAAESEAEAPEPIFVHRFDLAGAVSSIGAEVPTDGYEAETGEMGPADALPVPEWPDSSWVAPDVISDVDEAEVMKHSETSPGWAETEDAEPAVADIAEAPFIEADDDEMPNDPNGDMAEAEALAALADEDRGASDTKFTELDEDMLRNIVRDIIREELHGSLGERITRNVRKLVRAEINSAMATRDLE
jgi:hypothetical protein